MTDKKQENELDFLKRLFSQMIIETSNRGEIIKRGTSIYMVGKRIKQIEEKSSQEKGE
jgi:hypothetical protein